MEQKSNGALIGSIIIIVILIIGGVYLYKTSAKKGLENNNNPALTQPAGTTDEFSNLETDVNSTNLDTIDQGL